MSMYRTGFSHLISSVYLLFECTLLQIGGRVITVEVETAFPDGNTFRLFHEFFEFFDGFVLLPVILHEMRMDSHSRKQNVRTRLRHDDGTFAAHQSKARHHHLLNTYDVKLFLLNYFIISFMLTNCDRFQLSFFSAKLSRWSMVWDVKPSSDIYYYNKKCNVLYMFWRKGTVCFLGQRIKVYKSVANKDRSVDLVPPLCNYVNKTMFSILYIYLSFARSKGKYTRLLTSLLR